jgi:hypothetical protein
VRGQLTLPALGIALLLVTAGVVVGVVAADAALRGADRPALDRAAAVGLSEQLVRAGAPVTVRANVLDEARISGLTATDLRTRYGLARDRSVRLRLGGRTLVSTGDPSGGVTVERLVLLERSVTRTVVPAFDRNRLVTLPRRSPTATVELHPPPNTTLRTVRVNGRVRLHNASGLNGSYELSLSTAETARFRFGAVGPLANGSVRLRYRPAVTEKTHMAVTVDG